MSGIFGMNIKMAIYGESHGKSIGVVLDGLPPGLALDEATIAAEMARRAPGQNALSTARKESDTVEIQSGFFNGFTTGTPLCARIINSDQHSKDYSILADKMRPGHADYAGHVRYQGFNDYRGGGHFSGRLTAPLVFAGAVAKQALAQHGIVVGSHILQINDIQEERFNPMGVSDAELAELHAKKFAVMDDTVGEKMQERILQAKSELNSVGGVVEAIALHLLAGIGAPYFDSVESMLSHALFSVPAVKGVEFGDGFGFACMTGAEANDALHYVDGKVLALTNHNGGVTGGITNGMPLVVRVAIKPTPSIAREQQTVSLKEQADTTLAIVGRHDPCIVQRAVPVIEAVVAWTLWDLLLEAKKWEK
ncbi:chorismate synthase [uncultured Phascolarctobacterium sp.]|uniref:chorismate synthase n=1 Tax=uncultured Phascolarctobacterium sp. TaxID=512296 RepID=UPI0026290B8D|nr:chorismate synthase [uncultured Phascolarctobacterium sp.]